jgi:branched-subunit amino acid aminotransferase/4-amino-4-deoxychorismate lyase
MSDIFSSVPPKGDFAWATFQLLETMRIDTAGTVPLIDRHLARLRTSASHFGFPCDLKELREAIHRTAQTVGEPSRLRLMLSSNGTYDLQLGRLDPEDLPRRLKISELKVDSSHSFLFHKTTNRRIYEDARQGCDRYTDVILINERDEITETSIANVAVMRGGKWITPPVSSGLLPGLMRAKLLAHGSLEEGIIHRDELLPGEMIRCVNSVRGVFDLPLINFEEHAP